VLDAPVDGLITYYEALGPLRDLVLDDDLTEVMAVGPNHVYAEREGKIVQTDRKFEDEEHLRRVIDFIAKAVGRRIDDDSPMLDARLLDGSRVNAVIPPISVDGSLLTIRKFGRRPLTEEDLVRLGTISAEGMDFLQVCVAAHANMVISGGTGSGKTTLLNICSAYIGSTERIVSIEDAAELRLMQEHVCRLEARPADLTGRKRVMIRDLVVNALRMRPDRIIIGECRAGETLDMLQAMNTGHDGSLTTVHANGARDALARLETMVLMAGIELPAKSVRQQVASAINLVVHLARLQDGSRRITNIAEITGMEGDVITMQDLFVFEAQGTDEKGNIRGVLRPTGLRPRVIDRAFASGMSLSPDVQRLFPQARPSPAGSGVGRSAWTHR